MKSLLVFEVRDGVAVHKDVGHFHVVCGNHNHVVVLAFVGVVSGCEYWMTEFKFMCIEVIIIGGNPRFALVDIYKFYFSLEVDEDNSIADLLKQERCLKIELIYVRIEDIVVNDGVLYGMDCKVGG